MKLKFNKFDRFLQFLQQIYMRHIDNINMHSNRKLSSHHKASYTTQRSFLKEDKVFQNMDFEELIRANANEQKKKKIMKTYFKISNQRNIDMIIPSFAAFVPKLAQGQLNHTSCPRFSSSSKMNKTARENKSIIKGRINEEQVFSGSKFQASSTRINTSRTRAKKQVEEVKDIRRKNIELILRRKVASNFDEIMLEYIRRIQVPENSKIFIFQSSDVWIKQALIRRKWVENKDADSNFYHFKWTTKIDKPPKFKKQVVNHFPQSDEITSKQGLLRHLRGCQQLRANIPRAFDLGTECEDFKQNFNQSQILCGLKKIVSQLLRFHLLPSKDLRDSNVLSEQYERIHKFSDYMSESNNADEVFIHIPFAVQLCAYCQNIKCQVQRVKVAPANVLNEKSLKNLISFGQLDPPYSFYSHTSNSFVANSKTEFGSDINHYCSRPFGNPSHALVNVLLGFHSYLCSHWHTYRDEGSKNIWIVKNSNCSKGVGISLSNNMSQILRKKENKIVQKYMQNCLLYLVGKEQIKLDMRVWVLVTSFKPVIAYFYKDFYCRLCSSPYCLDNLGDLQAHLTNFNLNKTSFHSQEESILSNSQLFHYLESRSSHSSVNFQAQMHSKLSSLLSRTLSMFSQSLEATSNCFELFGADVLISNSFDLYLLEMNLSPACHKRTLWLEENVEKMADGLLRIVIDHESPSESLQKGWILLDQIQNSDVHIN